jgi:hypothetical protein
MSSKFSLPVILGGIRFDSKAAIKRHAQALRSRVQDHECLVGPDDAFVRDLFRLHERCPPESVLEGCRFYVAPDSMGTLKITRCFYLARPFGIDSCLEVPDRLRDVKAAARTAIIVQVEHYRNAYFAGRMEAPSERDVSIIVARNNSHVDHVAPWTFDRIFLAWLETIGGDASKIEIEERSGQPPRFKADDAERSWQNFHAERATLRVVSRGENLGVIRREARSA